MGNIYDSWYNYQIIVVRSFRLTQDYTLTLPNVGYFGIFNNESGGRGLPLPRTLNFGRNCI